jgi:hypothetical protein
MRTFVASVVGLLIAGSSMIASASTPPVPAPQPSFELWAISQGLSLSAVSCTTDATTATCYGTTAEGSAFGASATLPELAWTAMPPLGAATQETTTAPALPSTAAPPAGDNDHLFTSGEINIPIGQPGAVAIVMQNEVGEHGSHILMIVRNNTAETVSGVWVTGTARDSAGTLVATGEALGFSPPTLEAGDWSFGELGFGEDSLSGGETFEFTVQFNQRPTPPFAGTELPVVEANLFDDRIVGTVSNPSTSEKVGVYSNVHVACFVDSQIVSVPRTFVDGGEIEPGGTASFTVDLYSPCEAFALTAWG